jgi:hypothetical protein
MNTKVHLHVAGLLQDGYPDNMIITTKIKVLGKRGVIDAL